MCFCPVTQRINVIFIDLQRLVAFCDGIGGIMKLERETDMKEFT